AMRGVRLVANIADRVGGLFTRATNLTARYSVFYRNQSYGDGVGLWAGENPPWDGTCPCPPEAPTVTVTFAVFSRDTAAGVGTAIWTNHPHLTIESSILFDHAGTAVVVDGSAEAPDVLVPPTWRYD